MATDFYSVIARMGLDTTDFKRGLANVTNMTQAAAANIKQGLPVGLGRLVNLGSPIAAAIFATIEAFNGAQEAAEKFEEAQKKIIDNNLKLLETLKPGTQAYRDMLTSAVNNFQPPGGAEGAASRMGAAMDAVFGKGSFMDKVKTALAAGMESLAEMHIPGLKQGMQELQAQQVMDLDTEAKAAKNVEQMTKAREDEERELTRILKEQVEARIKIHDDELKAIEDKDPRKFAPIYAAVATDMQHQVDVGKYAADSIGQQAKLDDLKEIEFLLTRAAELQKQVDDLDKKDAEDAKKIAEAKQRSVEADKKELSIAQQKVEAQNDLADVDKTIAAGRFADADAQAAAYDQQAELKNKLNDLDKQATDLAAEKIRLQETLNDKLLAHKNTLLEEIAPTDEEIRKGKRGTGQDRYELQQADSLQKQAEAMYDQAQADAEVAASGRAGTNPRALSAKSQAEFQQAQALADKAAGLRNSTGSKEALQAQVTAADYRKGVDDTITELKKIEFELRGYKSSPAVA